MEEVRKVLETMYKKDLKQNIKQTTKVILKLNSFLTLGHLTLPKHPKYHM